MSGLISSRFVLSEQAAIVHCQVEAGRQFRPVDPYAGACERWTEARLTLPAAACTQVTE